MPGVLRTSMERMLPQLRAEHDLRLANTMGVATGSVKRDDSDKWVRATQKAANGGKRRSHRASSWEEHLGMLAARGLHVVVDGEEVAVS